MAAKTDAKPAPGPAEKPADGPATPAAPTAPRGGWKAWLPALVTMLVAPALSYAVAHFAIAPQLQKKLAATAATVPAAPAAEEEPPAESGKGHAEAKEGAPVENYEFSNVVVNLAGTMGTRYLKTSFTVTGVKRTSVKPYFESNKAKLTDITLNVLSSVTLADLEEPGSKNVLRDRLVSAYNQALGKRVVEQVYFSDFVVQ